MNIELDKMGRIINKGAFEANSIYAKKLKHILLEEKERNAILDVDPLPAKMIFDVPLEEGTPEFTPTPVAKFPVSDLEISKAMNIIKEALNESQDEGSYYYEWQSNIAVSFIDEYADRYDFIGSKEKLNTTAREAAKRFLDNLRK